jgi:hypothetical protein
MASLDPPALLADPRSLPGARTEITPSPLPAPKRIEESEPKAQAANERRAEDIAQASAELTPDQLVVEIDQAAGRFVSTLIDSQTKEEVWRYPSETQLAYSRAVKAYLRALTQF